MVRVPKLKLKLWQELVYFAFVGIGPVIIASLEIFGSHSTLFKITFSSIGSLLLVIVILRKFVFANWIRTLQEKCILLEHDYSIGVGDPVSIKAQWAKFNLIVYSYQAIILLMSGLLAWLFINALTEQLIAFKGAILVIIGLVLIGVLFKISLFIRRMVNETSQT